MADFQKAVAKLLAIEKGFAPKDNNNGAVNHGLTQKFLKSIGIDATPEYVRQLTVDQATQIYHEYFWLPFRLDAFESQELAEVLFFAVVNMRPERAISRLQLVIGAIPDGIIGSRTIALANAEPQCLPLFREQLKDCYRSIAEHNPEEAGDLEGWLRRVDA